MALPFLALAGAGVFGFMGANSANSANSANNAAARAQQEAANENVKSIRLNFFDTSRIASENFQTGLGGIENQLFGGFASGHSLNRVIAGKVADERKDQDARKFAKDKNIENTEVQKQNIVNQASSQLQSPLLAAVQGGISGFSLGSSLQGGLDALSSATAATDTLSGIEAVLAADPLNTDALASLRAVTSGVPMELINAGGAVGQAILQPFKTQIATEAFNTENFNKALSFQASQTAAAQQSLFQSQTQYDIYNNSLFGISTFNPYDNPLLGWAR